MERKKLTIGNLLETNGITIIPLISISVSCNRLNRNLYFYGSIYPQYIVLVNDDGIKSFTINGEDVSLVQLIKEIPELRAVLDSTE